MANTESGGGEMMNSPDAWRKLEKGVDELEELLQGLKKGTKDMLSELKMDWKELRDDMKELAGGEEEQRVETPKIKWSDYKSPIEGREGKKRADMQQKTLVNFGFDLPKKATKGEEAVKRKRSPEGQSGTSKGNNARGNMKKKKTQGEFFEKKKKETKEAG